MALRPFVDQPVRDLHAASGAANIAAVRWDLPPPELWRRGMNAIFRAGDVVLRVATPTAPGEAAVELHGALLSAGLPVPRPLDLQVVYAGGFTVSAWERVAETPDVVSWAEVGKLTALLHSVSAEELPQAYPLADPRRFPWWDFEVLLSELADDLDPPARRGIEAAIRRGRGWRAFTPETAVVCHGDLHPGNVLNTASGPVLLDWDLLCAAPRGWDHGPLMTWHKRWGGADAYRPFAAGYGWSGRGDQFAEAVAELRLVAATLMRVKAAQADPSARAEAALRLRYWRGERPAPAWTAQ